MNLAKVSLVATVCFGITAASGVRADGEQVGVTLPDLTPAAVQEDEYVDPSLKRRTSCTQSPSRPGWVMVQPKGYEWRVELAMAWKALRTRRMLAEDDTCTCDTLYPDWTAVRPEIEAMWKSIGTQPRAKWSSSTADLYYETLSGLSREHSNMSVAIGRLCSSPE